MITKQLLKSKFPQIKYIEISENTNFIAMTVKVGMFSYNPQNIFTILEFMKYKGFKIIWFYHDLTTIHLYFAKDEKTN